MARGISWKVTINCWVLLLILPALAICMDTRIDPETGRIRTLYGRAPTEPYIFALEDPRIEIQTALPWLTYATPTADLKYARRLARIYLPRTKKSFLGNTDLIVLEDIDSAIFTGEHIAWFKDAVCEEGLGSVMGGGSQGFGGNQPFMGWGETTLYDIIPVQCPYDKRLSKDYLVKFKIEDPGNELARSLPWESAPLYYPCNLVIPKDGCRLIIISDDEERTPIYFYWDVGRGRFVGVQNLKGVFGQDFNHWHYFQDSVLNTYYYAVGFPLPEDLVTVHELRTKWHEIYLQKKLLIGLIDFADRFGANMREVDDRMEDVEALKKSSDQLYLAADYPAALGELENALSEIVRLEELSVKLKDRALTWIYIIEWLVIFSTLMISGFILWTIMVRRTVYKEVKITSFERR